MKTSHDCLPKQIDSSRDGPLDHEAVQLGSAYSHPVADGKVGVHFHSRAEKADAAERIGIFRWNGDAKIGQRKLAVRHKAFPAGFVDGRNCAIGNHYIKAVLARRDRCAQSSRPAPDNEDVSIQPMN
jgi:hypothetical protein